MANARQNFESKGQMAEELDRILTDGVWCQGTKVAVAEEIFSAWSEWYGKIHGGGKEKLQPKQIPNFAFTAMPTHGKYWSLNALSIWDKKPWGNDVKKISNFLSFEHLIPRSVLRNCLGTINGRATKSFEPLVFPDKNDLGDFLEKFCVGVVLAKDEQNQLDKASGTIGGCDLQRKMPQGYTWGCDWKIADEWARYKMLKAQLNGFKIFNLADCVEVIL